MAGYAVLSGRLLLVLLAGATVAAALGAAVAARVSQARRWRRSCDGIRQRYTAHLEDCGAAARRAAQQQRSRLDRAAPAAARLPAVAGGGRWTRDGRAAAAATVRLGLGRVPPEVPLAPPPASPPTAAPAPDLREAAHRLVAAAAAVDDCPVLLDLAADGPLTLTGPRAGRCPVCSLTCQLATALPPSDLTITVVSDRCEAFGWVTALPASVAAGSDSRSGAVTGRCSARARRPGGTGRAGPGDGAARPQPGRAAVPLGAMGTPGGMGGGMGGEMGGGRGGGAGTRAEFDEDGALRLSYRAGGGPSGVRQRTVARPDTLDAAGAAAIACRLSTPAGPAGPAPAAPLGGDPAPEAADAGLLSVTLGRAPGGTPIALDLGEAAVGGDGPHGWIVGATGTGKSELLRRLVAGLAQRRSPADVAFVLVDFKGGAAFDGLAQLPHVAGLITNLDDPAPADGADAGPTAVRRMVASLGAEIRRRQAMLRRAGARDITALRAGRRRAGQASEEPAHALPHLVVVVDEAAELVATHPEALDALATVGRLGRSLGLHLVLATQRPDEARLRSMEGALRFRVCLRTLTAADSIAVLQDPGAAALPAEPGWALLAVDGPPRALRVAPITPGDLQALQWVGRRARPVWHPPLPPVVAPAVPPAVAPVVAPAAPAAMFGGTGEAGGTRNTGGPGDTGPAAGPRVTLGLGDAPDAQWQGPLTVDLAGGAGHLAIVGAPRTGRSTFLRALGRSLACSAPPDRLWIYAVGGPGLSSLGRLPHTGAVADPADSDLVTEIVATVADLVERRRAAPRPAGDPHVFLLLDDWPRVQAGAAGLEPALTRIAADGLQVGVHLAVAAHRWTDLRPALRDCFGTRLELHLPDPLESLLPRSAEHPPAGRPGRAALLAGTPLAGPARAVDGAVDGDGGGDGGDGGAYDDVGLTLPLPVQLAWVPADEAGGEPGMDRRRPAPVDAGPTRITPLPLLAARPAAVAPAGTTVPLGVACAGSVILDLAQADPHLLVLGDPGSGRSTTLRHVIAAALAHHSTESPSHPGGLVEVRIIDPRRALSAAAPAAAGGVLLAAAPSEIEALLGTLAGDVRAALDRPPAERHRLLLVVDDLDVAAAVTTPSGWSALAGLLPLAADARLSVVVARRCAGAARAAYDPLLLALREVGATGLLLSGSPEEGPLLGPVRAREAPPGRGLLVRQGAAPRAVQVYADPPASLAAQVPSRL